jgi:DNA-binding NtrC family response regulator
VSAPPKLLIVDDEPDMLDFLERVLRRRFAVSRAASAEDALRRLEQGDFEVLVTDQKMPKVTGLDLLERIADRYPRLVRVLISGFAGVPEIQRAVERCRIHNYILKPVDSQSLLEGIDQAYRVREGEPFNKPRGDEP